MGIEEWNFARNSPNGPLCTLWQHYLIFELFTESQWSLLIYQWMNCEQTLNYCWTLEWISLIFDDAVERVSFTPFSRNYSILAKSNLDFRISKYSMIQLFNFFEGHLIWFETTNGVTQLWSRWCDSNVATWIINKICEMWVGSNRKIWIELNHKIWIEYVMVNWIGLEPGSSAKMLILMKMFTTVIDAMIDGLFTWIWCS